MTRSPLVVAGALVLAGIAIALVGAGVFRSAPPAPSAAVLEPPSSSRASPPTADTAPADDTAPGDGHADHDGGPGGHDHPMPDPADFPTGVDPVRIEIPAIGVDADVVDLRLTADQVEVPDDFGDVGWWTSTRRPGEIGPAVMGGHVDSASGPAVFFRLTALEPGDEIIVHGADGDTRTFVVDRALQADKYERPPEVFGFGQSRPELRLITCGGAFDPSVGHYEDNYVVFAHQADTPA